MTKPLIQSDKKIKQILAEEGYTDIELEQEDTNELVYSAYVDAQVLVTVRRVTNQLEIYDQYLTDKHMTLMNTVKFTN